MKIYVIDTGYRDTDFMGHGTIMIDIIKSYNPGCDIHSLSNDHASDITAIEMNLLYVLANGEKSDILFTPWHITQSDRIDNLFKKISKKIHRVICTAGNQSDLDITQITPGNLTSHCDVIHCLRKSGEPATFATLGADTIGMYGTNITCPDGKVRSGSSLSAAIYCGIISRNSDQRFLRRVTRLMSHKFHTELHGV